MRRDRLAEYHAGDLVDTASFLYASPYRSWWVTHVDPETETLELVEATQEEFDAANGTSKPPTMSHTFSPDNLSGGHDLDTEVVDICHSVKHRRTYDAAPEYWRDSPRFHAGQRVTHKHRVYRLGHSWKRRRRDTVRIWALHDPLSGERRGQALDSEIQEED
jgi:hypothetical protein